MTIRSGEPPAAVTTRGPVAVAALPMVPTLLLALPLSACATVVVMRPTPLLATLIRPRTLELAPRPGRARGLQHVFDHGLGGHAIAQRVVPRMG
nr:hypothetical protein [Xanthomonas oryzae]